MGKGRWQENQGRNELLWDDFGKEKKEKLFWGAVERIGEVVRFRERRFLFGYFGAERMQLDWAVREKVKELQRELERGRGDDFLEGF